jgi:deazaflavin-dependent oxidoreductase (nitroreductase family)
VWIASTKAGSWFTKSVYVPVDKWLFKKTNGRRGLSPRATMFRLTTTGAKSGQPRSVPVLYLKEGPTFWVMASNFGQAKHPAWSYNLLKNPDAHVQIGDEEHEVTARLGTDEDKERLWSRLIKLYPAWKRYVKWTDREFRLFALEPRGGRGTDRGERETTG